MEHPASTTSAVRLVFGEFAPVFWEPLGRRGERLVVGVIVSSPAGVSRAYPTLQYRQLLQYLSERKTESALGVIDFAVDHFNKTLEAGGAIEDLKAPFARMSIGQVEAISARSEEDLTERALHLCTLLGRIPQQPTRTEASATAARTRQFIKDVRQVVRHSNPKLARLALSTTQMFAVGKSEVKLHFRLNNHFAQFCSLPLPNARPETATECQARLGDLLAIRQADPKASVALWLNCMAIQAGTGYVGAKNATTLIRQRTLDFAAMFGIPVREYESAEQAATVVLETAAAAGA